MNQPPAVPAILVTAATLVVSGAAIEELGFGCELESEPNGES